MPSSGAMAACDSRPVYWTRMCATALDSRVDVLHRRGVHHQRRVHAGEGSAVEHEDLAAAAFFGRGAEDRQRDAELVDERRERERGADRARGDDVVAARVTDDGQRVVLGADRDVQRTAPDPAGECGRQFADPGVDRETGVGEHAGRPRARPLFFELHLRVCVDPMAERDELLALTVDGGAGGGLRVHAGSVPP